MSLQRVGCLRSPFSWSGDVLAAQVRLQGGARSSDRFCYSMFVRRAAGAFHGSTGHGGSSRSHLGYSGERPCRVASPGPPSLGHASRSCRAAVARVGHRLRCVLRWIAAVRCSGSGLQPPATLPPSGRRNVRAREGPCPLVRLIASAHEPGLWFSPSASASSNRRSRSQRALTT